MFEFDAGKLVIIGIVALIVIGPKELPRVLRQVGQATAKLRRMAAEFQSQFMDAMREAELSDIKDEATKLAASARLDTGLDPITELKDELTRAIDGAGKGEVIPPDSGPAATANLPEANPALSSPQPVGFEDGAQNTGRVVLHGDETSVVTAKKDIEPAASENQ